MAKIRLCFGAVLLFVFSNDAILGLSQPPPLPRIHVLLPGFGQSPRLYQSHAQALQRKFDPVLIYDPQTLLQDCRNDNQDSLLASLAHTLVRKVRGDVVQMLDKANNDDDDTDTANAFLLDLTGFSLGGRLAMATACLYPERVRSLSLTGVGYQRTAYGRILMAAWRSLLESNNMAGFAWCALLASYSPQFLEQHAHQLSTWVTGMEASYDCQMLLTLLDGTSDDNKNNEYSVAAMAQRLLENDAKIQLAVGELDALAPVEQVQRLAQVLQLSQQQQSQDTSVTIFPGAGHSVPVECGRKWQAWICEDF